MRSLNRRYRGIDKTTDVLSFPLLDPDIPRTGTELLGDIVISLPRATIQAAQSGHSLREELDRLVIHGLLHLLGYDHERSEADARRMAACEKRLLEKIRGQATPR